VPYGTMNIFRMDNDNTHHYRSPGMFYYDPHKDLRLGEGQ